MLVVGLLEKNKKEIHNLFSLYADSKNELVALKSQYAIILNKYLVLVEDADRATAQALSIDT